MMSGFPSGLTSVLTGMTESQLLRLREKGLIVPEVRPLRPPLWSLRDLVALRSIAFLRAEVSLQQIAKAFQTLDLIHMQDHPSVYKFGTDGRTIFVQEPGGDGAIDLNRQIGNHTVFTFEEMSKTFKNFKGEEVASFHNPSPHIEVDFGRMGGWPTVEGTRVPYDTIANLVDGDTITVEDIPFYYPNVSVEAARGAIQLRDRASAA